MLSSEATVKIANLEYTGSEVKITGQEQFTKATKLSIFAAEDIKKSDFCPIMYV